MILLSALFLPFSLDLVSMGFISFVEVWWPSVFVLVGATLLVTHLLRRHRRSRLIDEPGRSDDGDDGVEDADDPISIRDLDD